MNSSSKNHYEVLGVSPHASEEEIKSAVMASEVIQKHLEGKTPKKVIVVKGKLVSLVM